MTSHRPFSSSRTPSFAFGCVLMALTMLGTTSCAEEEDQADTSAPAAAETATDQGTQIAQADAPAPEGPVYREMIFGDPNAPVTIVEYASLTCSHCATFHNSVLPELTEKYIDTGKVRLVFRDFPLNGLAMAGAMLARCAPGDRGKAMIKVMFGQQATWVQSQSPIEPLTSYAKLAGMSEDDVNACLENENIMSAIREGQETATNLYKIQATPTLFIEDVKVEGARPFDYIAEIIEDKLAEKSS